MNRMHLFSAVILLIFTTHAQSASVTYTVANGLETVFGSTLDSRSSIDFVSLRDNGQGGQYQLNSLTIGILDIPIPPTLWLFGSGLLGLAAVARRKKSA